MLNEIIPPKLTYAGLGLVLSIFVTPGLWAGATLDGSTSGGAKTSFSGTGLNFTIDESDGTLSGTNLFHSFNDFNIKSNESATFTGISPINNVVSRVTGGESSTINGSLTSTISGANFYLVNPSGVIFKEGATINVNGSFYATTSDYIQLGTDGIYYSNLTNDSVLTSSPPSSFGFLSSSPASIILEGAQLIKGFNLIQPDGASFSLIGGNITLDQAPEGTITQYGGTFSRGSFVHTGNDRFEIVSVASSGEVLPDSGGYDLTSFSSLGDVSILNGSVIDSTDVYIRGGNITIANSVIAPGFFYLPYFYSSLSNPFGINLLGGPFPIPTDGSVIVAPDGGNIDLSATNQVNIIGSGPLIIPVLYPGFEFLGLQLLPRPNYEIYRAGISTYGGNPLTPLIGAPASNVPDININAASVNVTGYSGIISERYGAGLAGNINITTETLDVRAGGLIANVNSFYGAGGNITINSDNIMLVRESDINQLTGIISTSTFNPLFGNQLAGVFFSPWFSHADSGNITINANGNNGLIVKNGAEIITDSRALGNAGNISISASDINLSRNGSSFGSIASQSAYAGNAGNITIDSSNDINISSGFQIAASVQGIGTGGNITVSADNNISIAGENSGIASATTKPSEQIKNELAWRYDSADFDTLISDMNSFFNAYVGPGTLLQADASMFTVMSAMQSMGFMNLLGQPPVAGNAGTITVTASELNMDDSSRITTSTSSDGNAGTLNINIEKLKMKNDAEIRSRSGLYVDGVLEVGNGNGGDISIIARESVEMESGASISSSSLGTGLAGNIFLDAGDSLEIKNSSITTEATIADGGNITIRAIDMIYLDNTDITTSVGNGSGNGGNIDIDPEFFILRGSNILANAYGGDGGNIALVANHFITSADSSIDASSTLGMDGSIDISSPDEEVADDLVDLPDNYLDVTSLMSERCGSSSGSSSLVDAGSSGMAIDPDSYLPSFAAAENFSIKNIASNTTSNKNHWANAYADNSHLNLSKLSCNTI